MRLVSRFRGESENFEMNLLLDYNNEVFSVGVSDKFTLALATSLEIDGRRMENHYDPHLGSDEKPSLLDRFDYVMHGKVYKFKLEGEKRYDH
jgi:DNA-directed RNA polymerase I, II, and III subunit RPABC3